MFFSLAVISLQTLKSIQGDQSTNRNIYTKINCNTTIVWKEYTSSEYENNWQLNAKSGVFRFGTFFLFFVYSNQMTFDTHVYLCLKLLQYFLWTEISLPYAFSKEIWRIGILQSQGELPGFPFFLRLRSLWRISLPLDEEYVLTQNVHTYSSFLSGCALYCVDFFHKERYFI